MTERPFDPYNYDEYNPDDFWPPASRRYTVGNPYEPTRTEILKSRARLAAADAILSPVGRVVIPDRSQRVRLANNIVNGEKINAEKAAKAVRQAFPITPTVTSQQPAGAQPHRPRVTGQAVRSDLDR